MTDHNPLIVQVTQVTKQYALGGYFEDTFFKMRQTYIIGHTGHLQVYRRGFIENGRAHPFSALIETPQEISQMMKAVKGVVEVKPRLQLSGLLSNGSVSLACLGQGIEMTGQKQFALQHLDLEVKTWDELNDFYRSTRQLFERWFHVLRIIIASLVVLTIANTMNMAVLERTRSGRCAHWDLKK